MRVLVGIFECVCFVVVVVVEPKDRSHAYTTHIVSVALSTFVLPLVLADLNDVEWDVESQPEKSSMHPPLARPLHFVNISFSALFGSYFASAFGMAKAACGRLVCAWVTNFKFISVLSPPLGCPIYQCWCCFSSCRFIFRHTFPWKRSTPTIPLLAVNGVALLSCCAFSSSFVLSPSPELLDWQKFTTY